MIFREKRFVPEAIPQYHTSLMIEMNSLARQANSLDNGALAAVKYLLHMQAGYLPPEKRGDMR